MRWQSFAHWLAMAGLLISCGCSGEPAGVTGGTRGRLLCGDQPLGDLQLTLHQAEGSAFVPVGFAVTAADGSFELLLPGAKGPLELPDGEYRCTLESVGAPVQFPRPYRQPESTPLKLKYSSTQPELSITGPAVKLK